MNFGFDLGSFIGSILGAVVTIFMAIKTIEASLKASLSSEATWREKLMDVASVKNIGSEHLLRLRASQRYCVKEPQNNNQGDEVRYKIWKSTNDLYERYILSAPNKNIEFKDQNKIRNLAIALLKYDYIKRGDNSKCHCKKKKEYEDLLEWIVSEFKGTV